MYGSFVVKLRNISDNIEIDFPSTYFRDLMVNLFSVSKNKFKVNILKKRENTCIIQSNEEFFLRITYFSDDVFTKLSQEFFKLKLIKLPFFNYHIVNFISSGEKNLWGKTYEEIEVSDNFELDFYTPILIKFGENFVTNFDIFLFLNAIYKENQNLGKFNLKKISKKINIEIISSQQCKVKLPTNFGFGFKGKIVVDLSSLDYYENEYIKDLLRTGFFTSVGYRKDLGYGMYSIKEIKDEISNI